MVANNEYRDFRIKTDDEFEEMDFSGRGYEFSSNIFTELDTNAVDIVWEYDLAIVLLMTDNTKLYKGIIFKDKEILQHMVKSFGIKSHTPYEVVESTPKKWVI